MLDYKRMIADILASEPLNVQFTKYELNERKQKTKRTWLEVDNGVWDGRLREDYESQGIRGDPPHKKKEFNSGGNWTNYRLMAAAFELPDQCISDKAREAKGNLSAADGMVLVAIAKFASLDTNECYPSTEKIAEVARVKVRTVTRSIKALEDADLLEVIRTYREKGKSNSNRYRVKIIPM